MMRATVVVCLAVAAFLGAGRAANGQQTVREPGAAESVPHLVQYAGVLKDAAAHPVTGVVSVTFGIYAEREGGAALWSETQNVLADANGHYSIVLGAATSGGFPVELFGTGQSRWLGVAIARHEESPRVLLASVPYALKAGDAETLGGLPASAYVTTEQLAASNARPATTFVNGGESTIIAAPATTNAAGAEAGTSTDSAQSVIQANPTGSGTTDYIPLWTSGSNLGNSILFESGSKIGIGTTTPASTLDINGGEILRGGFYEYAQGTATAATGQPSHSFQWDASVFSSTTKAAENYAFGFRAMPQNNNTAIATASLDLFYGTGGPTGSLADTGLSINSGGVISFVPSQTFSGASVNTPQINFGLNSNTSQALIISGGTSLLNTFGDSASLFFGEQAGGGYAESAAFDNIGIGRSSLFKLVYGYRNVGVGSLSLQNLTTGGDDVAIGYSAGNSIQGGQLNVAIGTNALYDVQGGSQNTAVGADTLTNTLGANNTAVGALAGGQTLGSYNTLLGAYADAPGNVSGSAAIGYEAIVTENNAIALGGTGTYAVNVGIGTPAPHSQLEISATGGNSYLAPNPVLTITGTDGGGVVALDFNTEGIQTTGTYNPSVRMAVLDESVGEVLAFYANKPGGPLNNGLQQTFAVDAAGNAYVTGTLSKAGGSFKIDDPIDPAGKYLSHSFVESPDMKNIYDGNVTTDAKGYATVTMPAWFEALNRDFRYQLTTINSFSRATVTQEIKDGKFRIRTSQPHVKVSWQVTGIRQDAWANAHRIPNEEEKPANEQGKYLHPELFGAGPEKAIGAAAAVNARTTAPASGEAESSASSAFPGGR